MGDTGGTRDGSGGTGGNPGVEPGATGATGGRTGATGGASSGGSPAGGAFFDGGSEGNPAGGNATPSSAGASSGGSDTTSSAGAPSGGSHAISTGGAPSAGAGSTAPWSGMVFDIELPQDEDGGSWCQGACEPAAVRIGAGNETQLDFMWGTTGRAMPGTITRAGGTWELAEPLLLGSYRSWDHAMCDNLSKLVNAVFDFDDHDGDGALDLVIIGRQVSKYCSDDYSTEQESDVVLTGVPDTRSPRLVGPADPIEPVHGVTVSVDKPLVQSATCTLVPEGGGTPLVLDPIVMNGYVVGFRADAVLPLGTSHAAQVVGEDFGHIAAPPSIEFDTIQDFGVLVQDGFESGSTSGIVDAEIVETFGVPAIEGDRMLRVAPGSGALLHLRRTGSETRLVMDVRKTDECGFPGSIDGPLSISAAVVGSPAVPGETVALGDSPAEATVDGSAIQIGELRTLSWTLPSSSEDVLVYLRGDYYHGAGCSAVGALLDNVRLE